MNLRVWRSVFGIGHAAREAPQSNVPCAPRLTTSARLFTLGHTSRPAAPIAAITVSTSLVCVLMLLPPPLRVLLPLSSCLRPPRFHLTKLLSWLPKWLGVPRNLAIASSRPLNIALRAMGGASRLGGPSKITAPSVMANFFPLEFALGISSLSVYCSVCSR